MSWVKHQMGYLLVGVIFWLPIGIVALIINQMYGGLDPLGRDILKAFLPDSLATSGTGMGLWVALLFTTGLLLKSETMGRRAASIPVVGTFFLRENQHTMNLDRLMHLTPCLFLYSPTCISYGWILSEQDATSKDGSHIAMMNVYYPNVPTLLTGQVYVVRKETVMKLGNKSREVVDILLYGMRRPESLVYVPWASESPEEFRKRAHQFGIM